MSFDSNPFAVWAIRVMMGLVLLLVAALVAQLLHAVFTGRIYLPDLFLDRGNLSWKKIGGVMLTFAVFMAILRDAADGTLSWELAAVGLFGAGLIDATGGGLGLIDKLIQMKHGNGPKKEGEK